MPKKEFLEGKQQVTLYPTTAQHKKLKELAAKRGKNLSTYILDSAFRDEKLHEKLDKIIEMLGRDSIELKLPEGGFEDLAVPGKKPDYIKKSQVEFKSFPKGGK